MELLSPAKINLFLAITGKRPDGYHTLITLMCPIRLSDTVTLTPGSQHITVTCSDPSVPDDHGNIAYSAARRFFDAIGSPEGVGIAIEKRIPVAAGLGGGSSNAATVLRGLNRLHGNVLSEKELCALGLSIGADVPFFIVQKPSIARGIGERIETYPDLSPFSLVLIFPGFPVPTESVYGSLNLGLTKCKKTITCCVLKHQGFSAERHLCNDLETVTASRYPVISSAKEALMRNGAIGALMSGSGPAVFGIFTDPGTARKAYGAISRDGQWQVFLSEVWADP